MLNANPVFVGMDLGTFKTSVASSTGYRDVLPTAVGWPRDHVAKSLLGCDVVFGKDLAEHRLALDIVRPFEKGALKFVDGSAAGMSDAQIARHAMATKLVIEHAVRRVCPDRDRPIYGVIGVPARASMTNKKFIMEAASATFESVAIVSEPFTIAYGMNRLSDALIVDIGAGTIDLCPMYGTYTAEDQQVTISMGGDHVDDEFERLLKKHFPEAQVSRNMLREIKERFGFVSDIGEPAHVTLTVDGKPRTFDVSEPLKAACRSIVEPIVQAVRGLIGRFDPEFQQRLRGNIILGGGGSQLRGLDRLVEDSLKDYGGAKVSRVNDPNYAGAVGALRLAMGMPRDGWTQLKNQAATASTATSMAAA